MISGKLQLIFMLVYYPVFVARPLNEKAPLAGFDLLHIFIEDNACFVLHPAIPGQHFLLATIQFLLASLAFGCYSDIFYLLHFRWPSFVACNTESRQYVDLVHGCY